jgi:DNA-binding MarR family transcriptional regulator
LIITRGIGGTTLCQEGFFEQLKLPKCDGDHRKTGENHFRYRLFEYRCHPFLEDGCMLEQQLDLAPRIVALIERLGRLTRGVQHMSGIKPAQWEALRFLAQANRYSRTPSCLASFLGSTRGTVSQTLLALEKKGLIIRRPREDDRRGMDLDLTTEGRKLLAKDPLRALEGATEEAGLGNLESVVEGLSSVLEAMRRRNGLFGFGLCGTCIDFHADSGEKECPCRCGRTGDIFKAEEATLICRWHQPETS